MLKRSWRRALIVGSVACLGCAAVTLAQQPANPAAKDAAPVATSAAPAAIHYVEREFLLPLKTMRGQPQLDVLEVRVDTPGRHPLAILTHGTAYEPEQRARVTPWGQLEQAVWFAQRGYVVVVVVRQGYGRSSGIMDNTGGGCGNSGSFGESGDNSAADLKAVMEYMATQPEVDASQIVSAGVSTGGFAQVALTAHPPPGLKAAISFAGGRGGDGKGDNCNLGPLIGTFKDYGKHSRLPMLWLYAENDKWFPPKMSVEFEKAFHAAGGNDEFTMVPPDGEDGHGYYRHVTAWSPLVESFLRAHDLLPLAEPLPPPPVPNVPAPPGLSDRQQQAFTRFLMAGWYKAFATNGLQGWGAATGMFTQELADKQAIDNCSKATKGTGRCEVVSRGVVPKPAK